MAILGTSFIYSSQGLHHWNPYLPLANFKLMSERDLKQGDFTKNLKKQKKKKTTKKKNCTLHVSEHKILLKKKTEKRRKVCNLLEVPI